MTTYTASEVAEDFRCSARKVKDVARANDIGINLEGNAGWRFTEDDKQRLWDAMRPKKAVVVRRRRRAA